MRSRAGFFVDLPAFVRGGVVRLFRARKPAPGGRPVLCFGASCTRGSEAFFRLISLDSMLTHKLDSRTVAHVPVRTVPVLGAAPSPTDAEVEARVRQGLTYVRAIVARYRGRGVAEEDLVQEGYVGLLLAARRYDPGRGVQFLTYANWWIHRNVRRAVERGDRTVSLSPRQRRLSRSCARARRELARDPEREPTSAEVARRVGVDAHEVGCAIAASACPVRLDEPLPGTRLTVQEVVAGPPGRTGVDPAVRSAVLNALSRLPARDAKVIRLAFGLLDGREYSLAEIATLLRISSERVRQIRADAMSRLAPLLSPLQGAI
jgi:RNA polymerase sigma factor (sigma-70 family)